MNLRDALVVAVRDNRNRMNGTGVYYLGEGEYEALSPLSVQYYERARLVALFDGTYEFGPDTPVDPTEEEAGELADAWIGFFGADEARAAQADDAEWAAAIDEAEVEEEGV